MAEGMLIAALIFHPAAPALLLTHGHECMVLKGSEVTGTLKAIGASLGTAQAGAGIGPHVSESVFLLPPRVINGRAAKAT